MATEYTIIYNDSCRSEDHLFGDWTCTVDGGAYVFTRWAGRTRKEGGYEVLSIPLANVWKVLAREVCRSRGGVMSDWEYTNPEIGSALELPDGYEIVDPDLVTWVDQGGGYVEGFIGKIKIILLKSTDEAPYKFWLDAGWLNDTCDYTCYGADNFEDAKNRIEDMARKWVSAAGLMPVRVIYQFMKNGDQTAEVTT